MHDCYSRCKKKITETYSKVTETEYECAGGKCKELDNSKIPNITTNVNITIGLNSSNCNENKTKSTGNSESENNDGSRDASKVTINNIITNLPAGSENTNCRCRKKFLSFVVIFLKLNPKVYKNVKFNKNI